MTQLALESALLPQAVPPATYVLHPGDVACAERGDRLETLLGSCVAVLLTDPRRTVGAMCHIVHAGGAVHGDTTYAAAAFAQLRALLQARAIVLQLCQAWVFGGGNMFPDRYGAGGHVGAANVRWVMQALADTGIELLGQDLGGACYRRIEWTVGPGLPQVSAVALVN